MKINNEIDEGVIKEIPSNIKLSDLEALFTNQIKQKAADIRKLTEQQMKLTVGFNQLEKVVNEIKSKGKEFLQLNSEATECPLCHTEYSYAQLVKLITKSKNNLHSSRLLSDLTTQIRDEKIKLQELEIKNKNVNKFTQVAELLFGEKELVGTITSIRKSINKMIDSLSEKEESSKKLTDLNDYFDKYGLREGTFSDLLEEAASVGIKLKNADDFRIKETKNKIDLQGFQKKAGEIKTILEKLQERKNDLFAGLGISKRNLSELSERLGKLKAAMENFLLSKKLLSFKESERIATLETRVEKIQQLLAQYKGVRKQKQEHDLRLKSANLRLKGLNQKEKSNKVLAGRASKACRDIEHLLTKNSKSDYLKKFIDRNKHEIVEIFKMIHAPKEFDDLNFSNTGNVSLRRKQTNNNAPLTQISTGQRSALSLSIFSALNRKLKNGPDILMFDDPVINVDDLNVLSYFDYLREVAINGKRQIFFATANENLAFLFAQKFNFLNDDFVTIELSR